MSVAAKVGGSLEEGLRCRLNRSGVGAWGYFGEREGLVVGTSSVEELLRGGMYGARQVELGEERLVHRGPYFQSMVVCQIAAPRAALRSSGSYQGDGRCLFPGWKL